MDPVNQRIVFFLRHYNDIDHIVPVIDKWHEMYSVPASVIITTDPNYLNDFRLEYIQEKENVTVKHIHQITGIDQEYEETYVKQAVDNINLRINIIQSKVINSLKSVGRRLPTTIPKQIWNLLNNYISHDIYPFPEAKKVLQLITRTADDVVVIFDWPTFPEKPVGQFTQEILTAADKNGYTTISLPHGDKPYANHLRANTQYDQFIDSSEITDMVELNRQHAINGIKSFDYIVHPNDRSAERVKPGIDPTQLRVLGSPRYNKRWISRFSNIAPASSLPSGGDYNIVLFLRNLNYPIFWSEMVRTIRLISQFEEFELIIKYHTRGGEIERMLQTKHEFNAADYSNVHMANRDVHSESLLQWADVVLDMGTSIAFEAIVREMPVLSLEFAHANESMISHYIEEFRIRHRDALYNRLCEIKRGVEVHDPPGRERFLSEMLGIDQPVLDNYALFLADQFIDVPS